ncbi:MAG: ABC transporter permease [Lachnospiraceae bacterium]|nr:ABC transporter permease [Lachnospiraceae bacterium]
MHNIMVIIKKQIRDTFKNLTILIQFVLFPLMSIIMEKMIKLDNMPEHFFTKLFAVMYIGMAPLMAAASIIAEEKEKNTLRVLRMADIKPWQYLAGTGIYVWTICMVGAAVMSTELDASERLFFTGVMGVGFLLSVVAGACIGIFAKNQMKATSLVMPCMMVLSFVPMFSQFNGKVKDAAVILYTQQLRNIFDEMSLKAFSGTDAVILGANALLCILLFVLAFRKKGLE